MHLVQILLPLYDNEGLPFPLRAYEALRTELTDRFGGITTYIRSPAQGTWKETDSKTVHDEIVIYEVMTEELDRKWWDDLRQQLCRRFRQESLIIRATAIEIL